jgi:hypothetical protein
MKKFVVLSLFGLLIVAISGVAQAQKLDFKVSGYISTTSFWTRNTPNAVPFGGGDNFGGTAESIAAPFPSPFRPPSPGSATTNSAAWNRTNSYLQTRAFLNLDMIMSKELSGRVALEIDALQWGGFAGATAVGTAGGRTSDRNNLGVWTADRSAVEVKNAYITAGLPYFGVPFPMTVNVGIVPLGVRPWVFQYTDGAGITGAIKIDPVTIAPFWGKATEGKNFAADDADEYGLHVNAKVGTFTLGGYGVNFNMNTYPLNRATATAVISGSFNSFKADFWWWGAYADGKLGPVDLQWDFVYSRGEVETKATSLGLSTFPSGARKDVDYRGWLTRGKINYPWEKFNFGAAAAYATGADFKKTSGSGLPGSSVNNSFNRFGFSRKVESYVVPPGAENPGANDDLIIFGHFITAEASPLSYSMGPGLYPSQVTRGSYGGTWFAKLFFGYKVTPWYKVSLEGLYIGDTTKNGNTFGDAVKNRGLIGDAHRRDDDTIGWELNLINEINIYKNLKWDIAGGYLWAGDALDQGVRNLTNTEFVGNKGPKNPWGVFTKLRYTF